MNKNDSAINDQIKEAQIDKLTDFLLSFIFCYRPVLSCQSSVDRYIPVYVCTKTLVDRCMNEQIEAELLRMKNSRATCFVERNEG